MDKEKSIDGLTVRRAKKPTSSSATVDALRTARSSHKTKSSSKANSTTTKPKAKTPSASTPKTQATPKSKTSPRASSRTQAARRPKSTPKSKTSPRDKTTTRARVKSQKIADITTPAAITTPIDPTITNSTTPTDSIATTDSTTTADSTTLTDSTAPSSPLDSASTDGTPTPSDISRQNITEDFLKPVQAFDFDEQTGKLVASKSPLQDKPKPKKEKKPISKKRKIITGIILAIVLLLIAAVIWFIVWGNDILAKITGGQGNIFDLFSEHYEPLKTDANGRTNILAIGTSGYDMEGNEGNGVHDGAQLTDSIMVISLNQETGDVAMLSLPRDLKVSSTCTGTGKINEVYWCNNMEGDNEQAGAKALMDEVGNILDVDFQYYAHLNWGSLVQIVDTLGGVTITLDEDIEDYYYTGAVYKAGTPYTISGIEAVALARARHGTASGDFSRGASQQKILIGIKDKVFEKQLSLSDIISLASTLGDNLRTNFSVDELKTMAHLTSEFDFNSIRQVSLLEPEPLMTTGTINGISYVIPVGGANYYTRIQEFVAKMFSNNPADYENASILILNGTDTPGLAATEENSLEEAGITNIIIDDAPIGTYNNTYTLYTLDDTTPSTKKLLEEKYSVTSKSYDELPAGVSKDYNFVLILGNSNNDSN